MKKKLLILTIVFGLILTMFPHPVYAANSKVVNRKAVAEKQRFKISKPTKAQIKAVGSVDEYYKQLILEEIDEIYEISQNREYMPEIKEIIDQEYENLSSEINGYENISDFVIIIYFLGMEFPVLSQELSEKLYTFDTLTELTTYKVSEKTNFSEFQKDLIDSIKAAFDCIGQNQSDYNSYYQSIIKGDKALVNKTLSAPTNWIEMSSALGKVRTYLDDYEYFVDFVYSLDYDFYCYEGDDEEDYYYDDDYEDEEELEILNELGITRIPEIYIGQKIYTNKEIKVIKEGLKLYLDNYVNKQLADSGLLTNDIKLLSETTVGQINAGVNVDEILAIYEKDMEKYIKMSGAEYKLYTEATYKRNKKQIEALEKTYLDPKKYYEDGGLYTNQRIINIALDAIIDDNVLYDAEIPKNIVKRVENLLKQTPTYEEELKDMKLDAIETLKEYKNNKKYNQTKVVPIVNEGIKKMNATKDIDVLWDLYFKYTKKAEATIYKFKITTSKTGKGTITKSATVKYGNNYTVKITPKAGYKISALYVDGKKVKATYKYTFKKVTKKHTIKVVFA